MTDADRRRWLLPPQNRAKDAYTTVPNDFDGWYEWEVPFDTDPDWPALLQEALWAYLAAWRAKMDEVNACIAANAEAYLDKMLLLLKADGVRFPNNKVARFGRLEALSGTVSLLFAPGPHKRVAVKVIDPRGD